MTKARKRKRVHRVARGKPKPGHIVAHNRRRRKGEILCHNHVLPYYGDRQRGAWLPLVHSVCASRMGPGQARSGKSARVDGVPNYGSTTPRPAMCNGGASKLKSAEALRLSTVRSVGVSASTATRTWDNQRRL